METNGRVPATPPLLIRRAVPAAEPDVAALLRDAPIGSQELAGLLRQRAVLVLSDVTLPHTAPPLAAAAFRLDRASKTAKLAGIGVASPMRGRGLGRRLLTGALTLLQADGFERVQASAEPSGAVAALLASAGFTADVDSAPTAGARSFLLEL